MHTNVLRAALKAQFYPYVEGRGFTRGKSSPLSTLFRRRDGETLRVFDIQWDKYHRACFRLNFGEADAASVDEERFEIWQCRTLARLQRTRGPFVRSWFQLKKPWLEAIRSRRRLYEPHEVAAQVIAFFPEIEAWWSEKREGPHLIFDSRAG